MTSVKIIIIIKTLKGVNKNNEVFEYIVQQITSRG